MHLVSRAVFRLLPLIPRPALKIVASRYIAGETLEDLIRTVLALRRSGLDATVDILGENTKTLEDAERAQEEYSLLVDQLASRGLATQISLKLTFLGLRLSEDLAWKAAESITDLAQARGLSVCLDMEDATTTDATLGIFRALKERHPDVSVAIQAYLKRSVGDVQSLLPLRPWIRVCKGIYNERAEIAFKDRQVIRENYLRIVELLLDGGGYPAIATHDPYLVDRCLAGLRSRGRPTDAFEFQMLLGVGQSLRPRILEAGSRLRLYCPYGRDWHGYSIRRLKENPAIVGHILRSFLTLQAFRRREARA